MPVRGKYKILWNVLLSYLLVWLMNLVSSVRLNGMFIVSPVIWHGKSYRDRFRFYHKSVRVYKIYHNLENRGFYSKHGMLLSVPLLGRSIEDIEMIKEQKNSNIRMSLTVMFLKINLARAIADLVLLGLWKSWLMLVRYQLLYLL